MNGLACFMGPETKGNVDGSAQSRVLGVRRLHLSKICRIFAESPAMEKGFLDKVVSSCIQNFLYRLADRVAAAQDDFEFWSGLLEEAICFEGWCVRKPIV